MPSPHTYSMACYTDRNWPIRLLCGSALTLLGVIAELSISRPLTTQKRRSHQGSICEYSVMRFRAKIEIVAAVVLLLVALYGFLWVNSSSHLARHFCQGEFSLFHEHFRCRQPYLGLILCVAAGLPSLVLFVIGWRHLKSARGNG